MDPGIVAKKLGLDGIVEVGRGGQKVVYRAKHVVHGDVVLKIILPDGDLARIEREIAVVEKIASARVPAVYEWAKEDGPDGNSVFWILEDRVDGTDLREVLAGRALAVDEAKKLVVQILEALADAEAERIVHRDVKPDNIMLDDNGDFWLLDFGIARQLDATSLTATAAAWGIGTPGYAPAEQFLNKKDEIDARTDLFALAVTVVESLTQVHPYRNGAKDIGEILKLMQTQSVSVPSSVKPSGFHDLITAMGQHRRDCRPSTAAEALAWMEEVLYAG